jgi:hypothetical protein
MSTTITDASAFISAAFPSESKFVPGIFIIDSGASQHMATSSALLVDVTPLNKPTSLKIGSGTPLLSRSSGSLILGPVELRNVLVVPDLKAMVSQNPLLSQLGKSLNADNSPASLQLQDELYMLKVSSATGEQRDLPVRSCRGTVDTRPQQNARGSAESNCQL